MSQAPSTGAKHDALKASIDQRNDEAWFGLDFDLTQARALCEWTKRDAEQIGYDVGVAQSQTVLAFLLLDESELDTALSYASRAHATFSAAGALKWIPRAYCAMGGAYRMGGDIGRCIEYYEKQRASAREIGDTYHEAVALHDIGYVLDDETYFQRALSLIETINYQPALAAMLSNLSALLQRNGELTRAREHAERALAIARNIKSLVWEAQSLWCLAMIHARMGDPERAHESLYAFESIGSQSQESMAFKRAQVYDAMSLDQQAIAAFQSLLADAGLSRRTRLAVLEMIAPVYARARRHREAYEAQRTYESTRKQIQREQYTQLLQALTAQHRAELAEKRAALERQEKEKLAQSVVELERRNAEMGEISIRDSVTGLYSRRYLNESVSRLIAEATRYGSAFSVALLDIDRFKAVNDTYGHTIGDAVIRKVADILNHELRASDIAARYGGDEFAMVFPQITVHGAYVACERIRAAIAKHAWDELQPGMRITASVGIAGLLAGDSFDTLFSSADRALYAVKRAGRNGVRAGSAFQTGGPEKA
jgi:diguanylate cyclase (GGDEF)-like protein